MTKAGRSAQPDSGGEWLGALSLTDLGVVEGDLDLVVVGVPGVGQPVDQVADPALGGVGVVGGDVHGGRDGDGDLVAMLLPGRALA